MAYLLRFLFFLSFLVFHLPQISDAAPFSRGLVRTDVRDSVIGLSHDPQEIHGSSRDMDGCPAIRHKGHYSRSSFKYVVFFFCTCDGKSWLGYLSLLSMLLLLFYMLGTTAADYFSTTTEKLSDYFQLSPAIAGVTLLAFGNGSPDVFSSIAAVVSSGAESLGISSLLGGSIFVTTVVSGSVGIATASSYGRIMSVKLDSYAFYRDTIFFLVSLAALACIIWDGKIFWDEALLFLFIYIVYGLVIVGVEMARRRKKETLLQPLLQGPFLPHVALNANQDPFFEGKEEKSASFFVKRCVRISYKYAFQWPLNLPRRLTIPIIEHHGWSRPFAVSSCVLAPLFLATLWFFRANASSTASVAVFGAASLFAAALGCMAFLSTEPERPPKSFLFWWLAAGFLMSVVWIYVIAQEIVAVLIALGDAMDIEPSILGITVLAWGNSIGDLVGNLCIAYNARHGVQMAMSGCYAGPMFNTAVGVGVSSLLASWRSELYIWEDRPYLLCTIIFTMVGLIWALITIPLSTMRLTRTFGFGLLFLYVGFMVASLTLFLE